MAPDVRLLPDPEALAAAVADEIAAALRRAADLRGRATLALSGGASPTPAYRLLATREDVAWERVHVFWADERCVPPDDPASNYRLAREALLDHVPVLGKQVHRMPGERPPDAAAEEYEATLRGFFGDQPPVLDVAVLGLGEDGHTASLFPGSPALSEATRWVLHTEAPPTSPVPHRLTLTLPVLNAARLALFVVTGAAKRAPARAALAALDGGTGADAPPAARVRPRSGRLVWFLDDAAGGG